MIIIYDFLFTISIKIQTQFSEYKKHRVIVNFHGFRASSRVIELYLTVTKLLNRYFIRCRLYYVGTW